MGLKSTLMPVRCLLGPLGLFGPIFDAHGLIAIPSTVVFVAFHPTHPPNSTAHSPAPSYVGLKLVHTCHPQIQPAVSWKV